MNAVTSNPKAKSMWITPKTSAFRELPMVPNETWSKFFHVDSHLWLGAQLLLLMLTISDCQLAHILLLYDTTARFSTACLQHNSTPWISRSAETCQLYYLMRTKWPIICENINRDRIWRDNTVKNLQYQERLSRNMLVMGRIQYNQQDAICLMDQKCHLGFKTWKTWPPWSN